MASRIASAVLVNEPGSSAARKVTKRGQSWVADEARRFLESAYADRDPLYPLWVLILVLGLRKGEVQGPHLASDRR